MSSVNARLGGRPFFPESSRQAEKRSEAAILGSHAVCRIIRSQFLWNEAKCSLARLKWQIANMIIIDVQPSLISRPSGQHVLC